MDESAFILSTAECDKGENMIQWIKMRRVRKENEKLEQENAKLKEHYNTLLQQVQETRKLHHDIRKHRDVLHVMIEELDQETKMYNSAQALEMKMEAMLPTTYANHTVLNAVIVNKVQDCRELGIDIQVEIHGFEEVEMKDSDIVVLFANLLNNAIEECQRLEETIEKKIELKCRKKAGNVILICSNSTGKKEFTPKKVETEKEDTFIHGLGLKILEEMLETYGANVEINIQDGVFQNIIMLPVREED